MRGSVGCFSVDVLGRLDAEGSVPWGDIGRLDTVGPIARPWSVGLKGKLVVAVLQGSLVVEGAVELVGTRGFSAEGAVRRPWRVGLQGR